MPDRAACCPSCPSHESLEGKAQARRNTQAPELWRAVFAGVAPRDAPHRRASPRASYGIAFGALQAHAREPRRAGPARSSPRTSEGARSRCASARRKALNEGTQRHRTELTRTQAPANSSPRSKRKLRQSKSRINEQGAGRSETHVQLFPGNGRPHRTDRARAFAHRRHRAGARMLKHFPISRRASFFPLTYFVLFKQGG